MESISIIKGATSVKKVAEKVQRQKSFFFTQIPPAFIQCSGFPTVQWFVIRQILEKIRVKPFIYLCMV